MTEGVCVCVFRLKWILNKSHMSACNVEIASYSMHGNYKNERHRIYTPKRDD